MKVITEEWGIEVQNVNLKDISFDAGMFKSSGEEMIVEEEEGEGGEEKEKKERRTRKINNKIGMQRAMAKKAEAERLREAKIIHAESEVQTAAKVIFSFINSPSRYFSPPFPPPLLLY